MAEYRCNETLKINNLEIVGFWDSVFYSDRKDSSGVIVQDKAGNKKCLSWADLKKMAPNDNQEEKHNGK